MPSKAAPNAFYMFMLAQQKKMKDGSGRLYSMSELPGICREPWKNLSAEERSHYDALAKREKQKRNAGNKGWAKMDSHGQVIAERKDPQKEEKKRREQEVRLMLSSWAGRDVREITFYVIDFQVMYDDLMDNFHLPMEIGLVSISLKQGISNYIHRFTNPGDPPVGNRRIAQEHSELTHQIPLNFQHADSNFRGLCDQMKAFLTEDPDSNDMPPVFCLSTHRQQVENCLEFIYHRAQVMPFIKKIYCLEDLVSTLISSTGRKEEVSQTQVYDILIQNRWDYVSNIRCSYHNECDCSYCSLSIVRRFSFAIFDILASLLDFELTRHHVPDETEQMFTVTEIGGPGLDTERDLRRRGSRDGRDSVSSSSRDPPSSFQSAGRGRGQSMGWQPPSEGVQMIQLSDSSSDEGDGKHDNVDDDDDDNDGDDDEGISAPQQQYTLKELRKPKSFSMAQNSSCSTSSPRLPAGDADANASSSNSFAAAVSAPAVRPLGSQMSGVRPMGSLATGQRFVAPPPGFRGRPLGPQAVVPPTAAWPALSRPGLPSATTPRPLGRGLSSARGRGYAAKP